jgi:hypothetical protein
MNIGMGKKIDQRMRGTGGLDWKIKERKKGERKMREEEKRKRNVGRGEWEKIVDE